MRTEEKEGLKLAEERLGADQSYCLFVFLVSCVSRHEEEEGLKAAEGRLWADHKPDRLHPDHCPAEGLILFFDKVRWICYF